MRNPVAASSNVSVAKLAEEEEGAAAPVLDALLRPSTATYLGIEVGHLDRHVVVVAHPEKVGARLEQGVRREAGVVQMEQQEDAVAEATGTVKVEALCKAGRKRLLKS